MPKAQLNCPNCRQPIIADIEQLFDVGEDPTAKQRLLSGAFNLARCPHCGFMGNLATPIVYHDPQKELLLTFVPPEVGLSRDNQERAIGTLINRVVNRLPQEKRKAYLLQPKAHLTMQSLIETILAADGITAEMIKAQQERLRLLQLLVGTTDDKARAEMLEQEKELLDADFFNLVSRLLEAARVTGDEMSRKNLESLYEFLLENTDMGHQIKEQTEEVRAAIDSLRTAGKELTREKLLDIIEEATTETRLRILVNLARPGMDYEFFRLLTERIERARGKGRKRLIDLREQLLELTRQYDEEIEARARQISRLLDDLLQEENIKEATLNRLPVVDDIFLRVLSEQLEAARKSGDLDRSTKLQEVMKTIEEASAPPAEITFIEELLNAPDDESRHQLLEEHREQITPDFLGLLSNLQLQMEQSNRDAELVDRFKQLSRQVRRFSMEASLRGD